MSTAEGPPEANSTVFAQLGTVVKEVEALADRLREVLADEASD